jgi:hypothetical protein
MLAGQRQEERELVYHFPAHVMPQVVTLIEVIALTEAMERIGSIELPDLGRLFSRLSSPYLISILKAAPLLALIRRDGGFVSLTDLGNG